MENHKWFVCADLILEKQSASFTVYLTVNGLYCKAYKPDKPQKWGLFENRL